MKKLKRILCLFLALVMCLGMVNLPAFAETIQCGDGHHVSNGTEWYDENFKGGKLISTCQECGAEIWRNEGPTERNAWHATGRTSQSDPEPTDPEPIDPEPTDPEPTDPEPIDPEPIDPEPSGEPEEQTTRVYVYVKFVSSSDEQGIKNELGWRTVGYVDVDSGTLASASAQPKVEYENGEVIPDTITWAEDVTDDVVGLLDTDLDPYQNLDIDFSKVDWDADGYGLHTSSGATDYDVSGNQWHLDGLVVLTSYTVKYVEKGTEKEIHASKTVTGAYVGDEINASDESIEIEGYTYDAGDPITLQGEAANNVLTLYYTPKPETTRVYVYVEYEDPNDVPAGIKKNDNGWYTIGYVDVDLPAATSTTQKATDEQQELVVGALNTDLVRYNDNAIPLDNVNWDAVNYGLHGSDGADNYVNSGTVTWHLDGLVGKTLTVTWVDEDGTQLDQKTFTKGNAEPAKTIDNPTKAEDEDNTYTFDGWEKTVNANGDVTYKAKYTATAMTIVYVYIRSDKPMDGWTQNDDSKNGTYWYTVGSFKFPASVLPSAQSSEYPQITETGDYSKVTWADAEQQKAAVEALKTITWHGTNAAQSGSIDLLKDVDWTYVQDKNYLGLHTSKGAVTFDESGNQWHLDGLLKTPEPKTVTLSYDAMGGEGAPKAETKTVDAEGNAQFTVSSTEPTREGYEFKGWQKGTAVVTGNITIDKDTTLYAKWEKVVEPEPEKTFTLKVVYEFYLDGVKQDRLTRTAVNKEMAENATYDVVIAETLDGYTTTQTSLLNQTLTEDTEVVVKYYKTTTPTPEEPKQVIYQWLPGYGGTDENKPYYTETIKEGETAPTYTETPTRDGYTFKGWDGPENGVNKDGVKTVSFTAQWEETTKPVEKVTVTWLPGYGDGTIKTKDDHEKGTVVPQTDYPANPTRDGYTFAGWSEPVTNSDGSITITAQWSPIPTGDTYTLRYNANGGKGAPSSQSSSSRTFTVSSGVPTYEGFTFEGWAESRDATVPDFKAGEKITITGYSKTLYAVWSTSIDDGNPPTTDITDGEVPLANVDDKLNTTDHFAYIIGYPEGDVRPNANITRAEAVTVFFRLMTEEFRSANWSSENAYPDVESGNWFNNAISTASKAGIFQGDDEGNARPNDAITRAEFAALAARFISGQITDDGTGDFADTADLWAAKEIRLAVKAGWIRGVGGNKFEPDRNITRAEVMTIVNRMLDRVADKDHMLSDMKVWSDNMDTSAWYYNDVQEATNGHDYERLEEGSLIEQWTKLQAPRDWAALETEWATAESGK